MPQMNVFIVGMPVKVGGGHIAVYAIFRDISERKQAETLQSALYRIAKLTSAAGELHDDEDGVLIGHALAFLNRWVNVGS